MQDLVSDDTDTERIEMLLKFLSSLVNLSVLGIC